MVFHTILYGGNLCDTLEFIYKLHISFNISAMTFSPLNLINFNFKYCSTKSIFTHNAY